MCDSRGITNLANRAIGKYVRRSSKTLPGKESKEWIDYTAN